MDIEGYIRLLFLYFPILQCNSYHNSRVIKMTDSLDKIHKIQNSNNNTRLTTRSIVLDLPLYNKISIEHQKKMNMIYYMEI